MEGLYFNVNGGYLEGIVRGYRNTLLTGSNYSNLTQCESLDDIKMQLGPAYGDALSTLPPNPSTSAIADKTTEKLVSDFRYLQGQCTGSLAKFMEYLTYSYMIDNVALLITGTLHERDTKELLERCHPLGWFETMPVLCVATNIEELYNSVLIETPLAPYFKGSLSYQDLDELNIEIIRNTLYKNYLEDFYHFVNNDPDMAMTPTGEIMSEILEFEADRRAINITLNSFGTELSKEQRKKLYPDFGKLYPEGMLMLSRADDLEGVSLAVSGVGDYKRFFDEVGLNQSSSIGNMSGGLGNESKSLEDMFYLKEMELSKMVFTCQFTHAVIYAWVKLREQGHNLHTWELSLYHNVWRLRGLDIQACNQQAIAASKIKALVSRAPVSFTKRSCTLTATVNSSFDSNDVQLFNYGTENRGENIPALFSARHTPFQHLVKEFGI